MTSPKPGILNGTLIAALATVGVCDVAFGLTLQLQPLLMEARGISAELIGTNAAAGAFGVLLAGPVLPRVIARFGGKPVTLAAIIAIAVCLAAMALLPPPWWWFPFRFVLGAAVGTLFTVSETWVLTVATDENRGRIMGIYTAMLSVTFAVGPMLLPFTGLHGLMPWLIGIAFVLLGLVPLVFVQVRDASNDGGHSNIFAVLARAPLLFGCICAATVFDSVSISFFSIFATRNGVPLASASSMLAAGIVAGVVFFYPLGHWADRWSKNGVVLVCTLGTFICPTQPNTLKCSKCGFFPLHASNGVVLASDLVDSRLSLYTACRTASPHISLGIFILFSKLLAIVTTVRFLRSTTPFC